jgi:HK97 family phage prohead protease
MTRIDLLKARSQFQQSKLAKTIIHVSFPGGIDLAAKAKEAQTSGSAYIELEGYASTEALNDRGFVIAASAWKDKAAFERIELNPIVLFYHRQEYPIGQIVAFEARPEGLWVKLKIRYSAVLPTQEKIGDLIADGTLRALSIGIDQILDFEVVESKDKVTPVVTKLRIGEISVVSVGSDMGAVCAVSDEFENIFQLASITDEGQGGFNMWKLLAKEYGMGENVTEEQVMAEYSRRKTLGAEAIVGLGLNPTSVTADELTAALAARDPKKLDELNRANAGLTAQLLVTEAVKLNKIADNDEDTRAWALGYATSDPRGFKEWMKLAKDIAKPNTTRLSGGDGGNLGGRTNGTGDESPYITAADREWCLGFGYFTDPAKMDEMAETTPNMALGWVFNQNFPATPEDKKVLALRRAYDDVCGIPARH